MRKRWIMLAAIVAMMFALAHVAHAQDVEHGVGFAWGSAPDPDDRPLSVGIWYPTDAPTQPTQIGPYLQNVAINAAPRGRALPLIVISHGTGGSLFNSADLATSLARAGFVVAAVTHTGDN